MQNATGVGQALILATVLTASLACLASPASASIHRQSSARHHGGTVLASAADHHLAKYVFRKGSKARYGRAYGGLQCVPFARAASGIELKGNAANWWDAAAGVYQRGSNPESGSVLNFRATGRMRLGHVAVVTAVVDSRHLEIEHANWSKGSVTRNVPVEDVSAANDWSQVRVGIGGSNFGSTYPTYGFIYDRPDSGVMVANAHPAAGGEADFAAAAPAAQDVAYAEVAEAPVPVPHGVHRHGATPSRRLVHKAVYRHKASQLTHA